MPRRVRGTDATALLTGACAGIADFFDQLLLVRSVRMSAREDAYARHQQARWMRPDAHRWLRQDAARFLKPDTEVASDFPSLEGKYNPGQPRVPAGRGRESAVDGRQQWWRERRSIADGQDRFRRSAKFQRSVRAISDYAIDIRQHGFCATRWRCARWRTARPQPERGAIA